MVMGATHDEENVALEVHSSSPLFWSRSAFSCLPALHWNLFHAFVQYMTSIIHVRIRSSSVSHTERPRTHQLSRGEEARAWRAAMAPDLVGMLAAGALKVAAGKAAEAAGDRIMLQWRFGQEVEDMQRTVESIQAVLEDAERNAPEDKPTQLWLERLTHASNDISDMFDEFEVNKTRKSALRKLKILNPCLTLASEVPMANKLKKARKTLNKISAERRNYKTIPTSSSSHDQQAVTPPEVIEAADIVGRDQEKKEILAILSRASISSNFIILPIYGMGGIGKTTLADMLFNDTYFMDYEKAWVYVSQIFDLNRIKEAITSKLRLKQDQLANKQEQGVGGSAPKSILMVLDDLWEKDDFRLGDLKSFLKKVGSGYKVLVIVTTRDASIAEKVKTIEAHNIHALSDDVCWDIIKQNAAFEQKADKERLEVIGKEIAKRCGGVALAARAIGYILRSKDFHGWLSLKDSGIWKESSQGSSSPYDNVFASLKLSYTRMPQHLRPCFAYCAIFPKGHKMAKDELIYQWAALGFIKPSDEFQFPTWQRGEDHIKQLLEMSFLSKSQSIDWWQHTDVTLFTMHDLVHDLARLIMTDEDFYASEKSNSVGGNCRYVVLADCSKPLNSSSTYPDKIRALRFLGSSKTELCHDGFSIAKYMRILDLGECSLKELPSSIGQLRLLRYLNAPGITGQEIPKCLTKLSKLLYLNLSGSRNLLKLPESIGEMEGLMYLDLSGCEKIKMLPEPFGKLKNLVHLDLSKCKKMIYLPLSFGDLESLIHLNLSECEQIVMLPNSFGKLKNLVHLDLSCCIGLNGTLGTLRNLTKLQYLNLLKCHPSLLKIVMHEDIGEFTELRYLNLSSPVDEYYFSSSYGFGYLPDMISTFSNSEHLDLSDEYYFSSSHGFGNLPDMISTFSNLEHLDLSYNRRLALLPDSLCSLRKLRTLDLTGCRFLRKLPKNMGHMASLKFLITKDCFDLDESTLVVNKNLIHLPNFVVHATEGELHSNLIRLKDASPCELVIRHLENVKSVEEGMRIKLRDKQSLVVLSLHWTRGMNGFVEDMELLRELVPPSNLELFVLQGYNSVSFPTWLEDITIYLPNLISVRLEGLSQCTNLPPLGQLPNLESVYLKDMPGITKIDRSFCGDGTMKAFTRLENLEIKDMENLEEWSTTYYCDEVYAHELMFPNLRNFDIVRCPKLRMYPCVPRVKGTWLIEDSGGVLSQWGESTPQHTYSTSSALVDTLDIELCMEPMHQWKLLYHLCELCSLRIHSCNDLSSSSEINGVLATLQSLHLSEIQALPHWIGECVSLKTLEIWDCGGTSFPESIQQLTKLQKLTIKRCNDRSLRRWMKLNKTKIGHIIDKIEFDTSDDESDFETTEEETTLSLEELESGR